ncbi:hypothetical protein F511_19226 [Dorcoceras hygrometricum]|uniref:Uncharacterized protein n=1 Tax=Dorcoceras hygrometricum TaxID=472368 RepID=A0A2Z7BQD6_9LAMI|nr:hypothetical protein F511_19226 [Dorcoceras hygrometricum]
MLQMREHVQRWWKGTICVMRETGVVISWESFCADFRQEYTPESFNNNPAAVVARRRRKFVFGQFDEENPFVQNSSVLLVQADEGVSFLVVDRIGDFYGNLQRRADVIVTTVGARHKCQQAGGRIRIPNTVDIEENLMECHNSRIVRGSSLEGNSLRSVRTRVLLVQIFSNLTFPIFFPDNPRLLRFIRTLFFDCRHFSPPFGVRLVALSSSSLRLSISTSLETGVAGIEEHEVVAVFVGLRNCGPVVLMFFNNFGIFSNLTFPIFFPDNPRLLRFIRTLFFDCRHFSPPFGVRLVALSSSSLRLSISTSLETGVAGIEEHEVVAVFVGLRNCGPVVLMFFNNFGEHCDVLSMQMDSDLVIYRTTLIRTFQVVTICRVNKSESTRSVLGKLVYLVTLAMSLFDLQDVCIAIGSLATLDLPMVVDLIGTYVLKGPYCTLTMTKCLQNTKIGRPPLLTSRPPRAALRRTCSGHHEEVFPSVQNPSSLLVQIDGGRSIPVVDLIDDLPPPTVKSQFSCKSGWSQAPRRLQVGSGSATAIPNMNTTLPCDGRLSRRT